MMPTNSRSNRRPSFDLTCLGEVMLRLDPGDQRIRTARSFTPWEGGGEYNVARGLRTCFGMKTAVLTALVDNEIGRLIENLILQGGVDTSRILWRDFDGLGHKVRNGLNFTERGFGLREPLGISDRGHSAASQLSSDDFDWQEVFGQTGSRWFHSGGIFAGLSENTAPCLLAAMNAAKEHGTIVSFDLNYRPSLWQSRGGIDGARALNRTMAPLVDVVIGNEGHFMSILDNSTGPVPQFGAPGYDDFMGQIFSSLHSSFPNIKAMAATHRRQVSSNLHDWAATLWYEGELYTSRFYRHLPVFDRVGGGDGFASGLIYGLLSDLSPARALDYGVAHGALAMSTPGDSSTVQLREVAKLVSGEAMSLDR
jgi:2-dehydro-3-deoxygluconokinase